MVGGMKIPHLVVLAFSFVLLAGCGKRDTTAPAAAPAAATTSGPKIFELTANDTMKYDLTRLEVAAGDEVTLTLTNAGSMPKQSMAHNFFLLKMGVDATAFDNAALIPPVRRLFSDATCRRGDCPHQVAWTQTERHDHVQGADRTG